MQDVNSGKLRTTRLSHNFIVLSSGYASDITRTFPVGPTGQFTPAQRELYAAVLEVQKRLITFCSEDAHESLNSLHNRSVELLCKALSRIGFDLGMRNRLIDKLYPHYLSHPIGIGEHARFCSAAQVLLGTQTSTRGARSDINSKGLECQIMLDV